MAWVQGMSVAISVEGLSVAALVWGVSVTACAEGMSVATWVQRISVAAWMRETYAACDWARVPFSSTPLYYRPCVFPFFLSLAPGLPVLRVLALLQSQEPMQSNQIKLT